MHTCRYLFIQVGKYFLLYLSVGCYWLKNIFCFSFLIYCMKEVFSHFTQIFFLHPSVWLKILISMTIFFFWMQKRYIPSLFLYVFCVHVGEYDCKVNIAARVRHVICQNASHQASMLPVKVIGVTRHVNTKWEEVCVYIIRQADHV